MDDRLQIGERPRIPEHDTAESRPVDGAINTNDIGTESARNLGRFLGAWPEGIPSHGVSVDDLCAEIGQHLGNRAFAARNVAGQSDYVRRQWLLLAGSMRFGRSGGHYRYGIVRVRRVLQDAYGALQ